MLYKFPIKLHLFPVVTCCFYLQNYVMLQFPAGRLLQADSLAFGGHSWNSLHFQSILCSALTFTDLYIQFQVGSPLLSPVYKCCSAVFSCPGMQKYFTSLILSPSSSSQVIGSRNLEFENFHCHPSK